MLHILREGSVPVCVCVSRLVLRIANQGNILVKRHLQLGGAGNDGAYKEHNHG